MRNRSKAIGHIDTWIRSDGTRGTTDKARVSVGFKLGQLEEINRLAEYGDISFAEQVRQLVDIGLSVKRV